ncbi:hypothetical protein PPYR_04648 [Photinus pyralis]|uniref:ER membrane protein complex subunit 2 n=1 Tax=Photinus pyralis TaxID=7054 RepID=A0A1Y1KP61_PHOPY|nr:ER membrane protein complex subunit 2-like [Photinus pyralis]KAB0802462.1 hypothetical protein PPYR_04648 [Photinus pyralis]
MNDLSNLSWSEARDLLRTWRDDNDRRSEEVLQLWKSVLEYNLNKLGGEKFSVLEQVCLAALDCYQIPTVDYCIKQLSNEFPSSLRVKKYYAMRLEAQECYDDALTVLDSLIKKDETNNAPRKRKISILRAQGKNVEAIKELTEYLKIFMSDIEGWQELSDLYIAEQDYNKAAFCVEELILHNPHNHLLHQRYADIRYTQGGYDNVELARGYYCQALKLNQNNLRALYGVYLTSSSIAASPKCTAQKKKEMLKLVDWALLEIKKRYSVVKDTFTDNNIEERLSVLQIS